MIITRKNNKFHNIQQIYQKHKMSQDFFKQKNVKIYKMTFI